MNLLLLAAALGVGFGCGPRPGPQGVLDRYARLLEKRDYNAAYDLMSDSYRVRVTRAEYVQMMNASSKEADETAVRLKSDTQQLTVAAEFRYGIGDELRLMQQDGAWRVVGDPFDYYDQSSPHSALLSFLRAARLAKWDAMLKFVPNAYVAAMDAEKLKAQFTGPSKPQIDALIETIRANQNDEIVESGSRAILSYGANSEVVFIREDGLWKIQDLD
jgi:hypothetical protein